MQIPWMHLIFYDAKVWQIFQAMSFKRYLLTIVLISYHTWCNYTLQLWHHIKLFSNREYVFQVVDQSCIHYSKFVPITAFAFWHWPGCKCSANLIFHPVNVSIILGVQSPTRSRKTPTVREFKPEIEGVMRSNVIFTIFMIQLDIYCVNVINVS